MQPLQTSVQSGPLQTGTPNRYAQTSVGYSGPIQRGFNGGDPLQTSIAGSGDVTRNVGEQALQTGVGSGGDFARGVNPGNVQQSISYDGLSGLPQPGGFEGAAKSAADGVYKQVASRLDPQFQQSESDIRSRLANQGISENSDAYRRELDNFGRSKNDAYNQANYSAVAAGLAAQQQGYGQALATRQQGTTEVNNQGQFFNEAQNQQFQQGHQNANLNNAATQAQFGQNLAAGQFGNEARNAMFQQGQQNAALNNSAQGQIFGQNAQNADFYNKAQGQNYTQNLGAAQFANQAQDQRFSQNLAGGTFANQAQGQNFAQDQSQAVLFNNAQNQQFNQDLAGGQFGNNARQQQINEASYLRNLPLNDIASLLGTGGGPQQPTFNPFSQVGVAAPDYQGAVYQNYNAANQQYQSAQQARSQGLGGIFGALGSIGAAALPVISDRRLKTNIKRIGQLANGLATYSFKYIGDKAVQFGIMAQEAMHVIPEAVGVGPNGYFYVDYRKVW